MRDSGLGAVMDSEGQKFKKIEIKRERKGQCTQVRQRETEREMGIERLRVKEEALKIIKVKDSERQR